MVIRRGAAAIAAALAASALAGCALLADSFLTNDFSGDPFPINVDTSSGAIMVGLRVPGLMDRTAVLDLLSPFTTIDPGTTLNPGLSFVDLTLLGKGNDGQLSLPRAEFPDSQLIRLHPCTVPDGDKPDSPPPCSVGPEEAPVGFNAVVGADVLAGDAVRLRLGAEQLFVLPDIGGADRGRTLDCDAVFNSPYRGGGTLVIDGTELAFGNRRIAVQACLGQAPEAPVQGQRGTDALLVVSTSIGVSLLGEAAYMRYQLGHPTAPVLTSLKTARVNLPSGLITGRRATIDQLALVATSTANALAPCRQLYAHRVLAPAPLVGRDLCDGDNNHRGADCPCEDGGKFCAVPAILELKPPTGIDVLVVPDTDDTLQALRTELRPDQPEVDGILGTGALRAAEIDVDYPHDRLIARCPDGNCCARPQLAQEADRDQINRCLAGQPVACPVTPLPLATPPTP
jgi:hypothetical protein